MPRQPFFVIGKKVEQNSALCRRIVSEGHTLENHTYSHPAGWWWVMPRPLVRREIDRGYEAILAATGHAPRFFRSPVGMNNLSVHPIAAELGTSSGGLVGGRLRRMPCSSDRDCRRGSCGRSSRARLSLSMRTAGSRHRLLTLARLLDKLGETGYRSILPPEHILR